MQPGREKGPDKSDRRERISATAVVRAVQAIRQGAHAGIVPEPPRMVFTSAQNPGSSALARPSHALHNVTRRRSP